MQKKYGIAGDIKLEHVLAIPEVLQFTDGNGDNEVWEKHLKAELDKALDGVIAMREKEGANLAVDLTRRVIHLNEVIDKVEVTRSKFSIRSALKRGRSSSVNASIRS